MFGIFIIQRIKLPGAAAGFGCNACCGFDAARFEKFYSFYQAGLIDEVAAAIDFQIDFIEIELV